MNTQAMTTAKSENLPAERKEELMKQWRKSQNVVVNKPNTIYLDNAKMNEKGDALNPNYGKIFAVKYKDGEEVRKEIDLATAKFFVAKIRVQINQKPGKDGKSNLWCREIDSTMDWLQLYDQEKNLVAEGMYSNLKEEYDLKYSEAAYTWYNGDIYRWKISGAHFESWFKIKKKIQDAPHYIRVSDVTEDSFGTVFFNRLTFEIAEPFPLEQAVEIAGEIDEGLKKYYETLQEKEEAEKEAASAPTKPTKVQDVSYENAEKELAADSDEAVLSDLPF